MSLKIFHHKHTLMPPSVDININYKALPGPLIDQANHFARQGKDYYAIDAVTHEKRYFSTFDDDTRRIASALYRIGLRKGNMVICMPSEMIKLHIFFAGVWRANGMCRVSNPVTDPGTLRARIKESHCKFLFCDRNGTATCRAARRGISWKVRIICTDRHDRHTSVQRFLEKDDGNACPNLTVGLGDTALILCTSGTSGPSKSAVYTHAQLLYNIHMFSLHPFTESRPNLLFASTADAVGTTFPFSLLISGKTCILTGKMSGEIILNAVQEFKPNFAFAFPSILPALVGPQAKEYDLTSLEIIWSAGARISTAVKNALLKLPNVKDFISAYGLTESMIGTTSAILPATGEEKSIRDLPDLSVGRTYPNSYLQIRDDETLEVLGPYEVGEICCKNPGTFKEYYNNRKATKKAFIDGFVRTGDLGYFDDKFNVFIKDRMKDVFKYFNNYISPSELEIVLEEHPNVKEACVIGVPARDGGGEVPRAYVIVTENLPLSMAEHIIRTYADEQLPDFKQLRGGVYIVPELPKGTTGKVVKHLVAKLQLDKLPD